MGRIEKETILIPAGAVVLCLRNGVRTILSKESRVVVHTRKFGCVYYLFDGDYYKFRPANNNQPRLWGYPSPKPKGANS